MKKLIILLMITAFFLSFGTPLSFGAKTKTVRKTSKK